jgi:signal transduction histidine kinase
VTPCGPRPAERARTPSVPSTEPRTCGRQRGWGGSPLEAGSRPTRIALEALHNAVKHAEASAVRVDVIDLDDAVAVTVTDDGRGFDPTIARPGHLGLTSMRERAAAIGADLHLSTSPGAGTTVRLTVSASPAAN